MLVLNVSMLLLLSNSFGLPYLYYKHVSQNKQRYTEFTNPQKMNEPKHQAQPTNTESQNNSPYFKLVQLTGSLGTYQKISLFAWCIFWMVNGALLYSTPFMMYVPPYDCSHNTNISIAMLSSQQCQTFVCELPQTNRTEFVNNNHFNTVGTSFQDMHCTGGWILDFMVFLMYMGAFVGYMFISVIVDNFGRKSTILLGCILTILGLTMTVLANNFVILGIGIFIAGFGSDAGCTTCFTIITQTVQPTHSQKYSILIQAFYCFGGLINIAAYYFFQNWRIVILVAYIAPTVISLFVIVKFIKETPYFMIALYDEAKVLKQLSEVYQLNYGQPISAQKCQQITKIVSQLQQKYKQNIESSSIKKSKKVITPIDLFRYKSIRLISISCCVTASILAIVYYGPTLLISKFSFSIYINALVVTMSQFITYIISYLFINKMKRRIIGFLSFAICFISSFGLIFVFNSLCDDCQSLKVIQLILVFIFRFFSSMYYAIFLVYQNELFPTQVRGTANNISSAIASISSTGVPFIFGSQLKTNKETSFIMIGFAAMSTIGAWLTCCCLPQTLNSPIKDNIQEISHLQTQGIKEQNNNKQEGGHVQLVQVKQSD